MQLGELDFWIILAGVLCAAACALLGNFLVLRKMSMMGDAISHAVLPGLAVAFLLTESRASIPMFIGAAAVGVLTALFTEWVRGYGRVDEGASMGVVFTALFALGLILIVQAADHVDLDPGCVLYGASELTPLDRVTVFGYEVPRAVVVLSIVLAIDLAVVLLFYKELKLSSFDPNLATTLGISSRFMHYLLMTLVAVTTVAAFESVGSILVVAMLIVPPAAAHLLTDRLGPMIVLSLVLGALSAILGHLGAIVVPAMFGHGSTSTAGMMAVAAGVLFLLAVLAAPRQGVLSKIIHRSLLSLRILREDVLGLLARAEEIRVVPQGEGVGAEAGAHIALRAEGSAVPAGRQHVPAGLFADGISRGQLAEATLADPLPLRLALWQLSRSGLVVLEGAAYRLTDGGRRQARDLVRSHRLWETYLARHLGLADDHVHPSADRLEHVPGLAAQLDVDLDRPARDPHASRIPPPQGT